MVFCSFENEIKSAKYNTVDRYERKRDPDMLMLSNSNEFSSSSSPWEEFLRKDAKNTGYGDILLFYFLRRKYRDWAINESLSGAFFILCRVVVVELIKRGGGGFN